MDKEKHTENVRYQMYLYDENEKFIGLPHRSLDIEDMKKELLYIKKNDPESLKRLKVIKITTTYEDLDISSLLEE